MMYAMNGMLWFDNDPKSSVEEKIKKAVAYYLKKYEVKAEVCLINPSQAQGLELEKISVACGVTVRTFTGVTPSHFWVGVEEKVVKV